MFVIPQPYIAYREKYETGDDGINRVWEQCRVIGITTDEDGDPAYLVEVKHAGTVSLAVEPYLRPAN